MVPLSQKAGCLRLGFHRGEAFSCRLRSFPWASNKEFYKRGSRASLVTTPNWAPRLRERWLNQYSYRSRLSTSYPAWLWGKVVVLIGALLTIALVELLE
jgi:hypothetical protein